MQNVAYRLAFIAATAGVVLLMMAGQGDSLYTSLGTTLLLAAVVLAGIGKAIDLLHYVGDGAAEPDKHE